MSEAQWNLKIKPYRTIAVEILSPHLGYSESKLRTVLSDYGTSEGRYDDVGAALAVFEFEKRLAAEARSKELEAHQLTCDMEAARDALVHEAQGSILAAYSRARERLVAQAKEIERLRGLVERYRWDHDAALNPAKPSEPKETTCDQP